jgi:hypothetical protein
VVVYVIKRPLKKFIFRWSINVLLLWNSEVHYRLHTRLLMTLSWHSGIWCKLSHPNVQSLSEKLAIKSLGFRSGVTDVSALLRCDAASQPRKMEP